MQYLVLQNVVIDGRNYSAGDTVETTVPSDRLVALGFIEPAAPKQAARTTNRRAKPKVKRDED